MPKESKPVPVASTRKASGHASAQQSWSKPSSFFKDRRRQQSGDPSVPQTGLLKDIQTLTLRDVGTVRLFRAAEKAGCYDDDNMLLERLIQLLYKLPRHSRKGKLLTDAFITKLWSTLDHPQPQPIPTLIGPEHRRRTGDGSFTNPYIPTLGAAGTAYARAVTPVDMQSPDLPDPGLVFETLLARGDDFRKHPCGISSMMFYLGVIITHDIFQSSGRHGEINNASSYLDLAPLYGNSEEEQKEMRQFKEGLLKPDCFSHRRILTFPPACCVFLLMFNRFHNYVATELARINEGGRFNKPHTPMDSSEPSVQKAWEQYDEDLFQTARLVTCGLYINIILKDYVRVILGLNRTDSTWTIDPRSHMDRHSQKDTAPTGVGNQVSVEFNLLYRWHAILSKNDSEYTAKEMRKLLDGKDPEKATFHEMIVAFNKWETALPEDPTQRASVPGLERGPDGIYSDDEMVEILRRGIEDTAGSFGARSVPNALRPVEMLGIMQARRWRVGTLNEFRSFIGLTRHSTFEDINPDPKIAAGLKALYGSPANVELYPGLAAEKTKPAMAPGSGVCVGYTSSRAILSDAVALVRGDRFYTDDFIPKNLTNWGFSEVDSDLDVDSGNVMYKLIFCAFPDHFDRDSIYAHHPLVTPAENKIIFSGLGKAKSYSWDVPKRQATAVDDSADREENGGTQNGNHASKEKEDAVSKASKTRQAQVTEFVSSTARQLIKSKAHDLPGKHCEGVDVIDDIISLTFVRLTAEMFTLSIKASGDKRRGAYTDTQLCTILSVLHAADSTKLSPGRSYELRRQAKDLIAGFRKEVPLPGSGMAALKGSRASISGCGQRMIEEIEKEAQKRQGKSWKKSSKEETAKLVSRFAACSTMVPVMLLSESLDYHLGRGLEHMGKLGEAAAQNADDVLLRSMLEGCSLSDRRSSASSSDSAGSNENATAQSTLGDYFPAECRPRGGNEFIYTDAMLALFKVLVSLPGLRRATGAQGHMKRVSAKKWTGQVGKQADGDGDEKEDNGRGRSLYMTSDCSSLWPVPTTMKVVWDLYRYGG